MWNKKKEGKIFIISGPSGSGKTTLKQKILSCKDINFTYSISYTTRKPLKGEKNKKDYFFVSEEVFLSKVQHKDFLEYANVYGYYYGTDKAYVSSILKKGHNVLIDVDIQGASKLKKLKSFKAVYIFILPPSLSELKKRLEKRKRDNKKEIAKRMKVAIKEINQAKKHYEYCIINKNIKNMVEDIRAIISAELLKSSQYNFKEQL
ncbi:MAG: guanylate kinase [Candidatus Aureabacteria bacterium]|nr:guanylate kinase [Candidatus Auribacterota bacterium]